jgi:hypothetical protein
MEINNEINDGGCMDRTEDWAELRFNDPSRIPIGKCQQNLFDIVRQVKETKTRRLITKEGIVVAVLSPLQEVAMLDELLEKQGELII